MRVMDFENIATVKGTSKHASATNCRTSKITNEGTVIIKTTRDEKKEIEIKEEEGIETLRRIRNITRHEENDNISTS